MATNNFLTFAPNANTAGGSNFLSQSAYADDDERYSGVLYGAEARSGLMNKALRQGVNMASAHAQAVSDIASVDMLDDGTTTTLISGIKAAWTQSAVTAIAAAAGVSICPLVSGLVPAANLPSYVDDVLEYSSLSAFPTTGETGKIYVAIDTKLTYRWSGSAYIELSQDAITAQKWSTAKTLTVSGIVSGSVSSTWESGPTVSLDVIATDATLAGTEYFPLKQGSSFMRTTLDAIKTYVNSGSATTTQVGNYKAYTAITTSRALTAAESGSAFLVTGSPTITTPTAVASNLRYKLYAGSAFTLTAASGTFYGYIDADMTTSISVAAHQSIEIICDGGNWEVIGGLMAPNSAGVRAVALTGLDTSSATAITATDTLLSAAGKLQAQISANLGAVVGTCNGSNTWVWKSPTGATISTTGTTTNGLQEAITYASTNGYGLIVRGGQVTSGGTQYSTLACTSGIVWPALSNCRIEFDGVFLSMTLSSGATAMAFAGMTNVDFVFNGIIAVSCTGGYILTFTAPSAGITNNRVMFKSMYYTAANSTGIFIQFTASSGNILRNEFDFGDIGSSAYPASYGIVTQNTAANVQYNTFKGRVLGSITGFASSSTAAAASNFSYNKIYVDVFSASNVGWAINGLMNVVEGFVVGTVYAFSTVTTSSIYNTINVLNSVTLYQILSQFNRVAIAGVQKATTPVCVARQPSATTISLSAGVATLAQLSVADTDTHGGFVTATYKYVAPIPGWYRVTGMVRFSMTTTEQHSLNVEIWRNGGATTSDKFRIAEHAVTPSSVPITQMPNGSALIYLNGTGDYVQMYVIDTKTGTTLISVDDTQAYSTKMSIVLERGAS